jgi:hypothetical protein
MLGSMNSGIRQPAPRGRRRDPSRLQLRRVEHWHQRAAADLARLGASRADLVELERITERLREQAYNL